LNNATSISTKAVEVLLKVGVLCLQPQKLMEAKHFFQRVVNFDKMLNGKNSVVTANSLIYLAYKSSFGEAKSYAEEAASIVKKIDGPDRDLLRTHLSNLQRRILDASKNCLEKSHIVELAVQSSISKHICTYSVTNQKLYKQKRFSCYTCADHERLVCCEVCALFCHIGHQVLYKGEDYCFCDCGPGSMGEPCRQI